MTVLPLLLCAVLGLGDFDSTARDDIALRVRRALQADRRASTVEGTVTGVGDGSFVIQQGNEALKIRTQNGAKPAVKPGETVRAEGVPTLEGGRVLMTARKWQKTGRAELPTPRVAGYDELTDPSDKGVNWLRVEVSGRATVKTENGFAIDMEGLPVTVLAAKTPSFIDGCDKTHPRVKVCGVVEMVLDQSVLFGQSYVMGVRLQVNNADDIVLLPDAVYLVNVRDRRVMAAIIGAFVLLGVGLVVLAVVILRQQRRSLKTHTLMAERKRMADDIHDTIEQHLVGAGMLIQLNRNKEAREILLRAKTELRDIIWGLKNDDMMRLTPTQMLKELAEVEVKKGIFRVTQKLEGLPETLPAQAMRDLSLIVREAIGNAVKHGQAKCIAIVSDPLEGGGWQLRVANDGKPFDASRAPGATDGHFGLEGMRERAKRNGMEATIEVAKNNWTVVTITKRGAK